MLKRVLTKTREMFIKMLPTEIFAELDSLIHREDLAKGTILLREGELGDKVYFLKKGWAYCYYYDAEDDRQIVTWILGADHFLFSPDCVFDKTTSKGVIELLDDSTVSFIYLKDAENLSKKYSIIHHLCSITFHKETKNYAESVRFLHMKTTEEKYKAFCKKFKDAPHLSDAIIAGYIGVRPSSLNRLLNTKRL